MLYLSQINTFRETFLSFSECNFFPALTSGAVLLAAFRCLLRVTFLTLLRLFSGPSNIHTFSRWAVTQPNLFLPKQLSPSPLPTSFLPGAFLTNPSESPLLFSSLGVLSSLSPTFLHLTRSQSELFVGPRFSSCCCCCCLPDPFRGMGAWRNTMEPQKPGNFPGSGPEVVQRQRVAKE